MKLTLDLSLLIILILQIRSVHNSAALYVFVQSYENDRNLGFSGQCCDAGHMAGQCTDSCDLLFEVQAIINTDSIVYSKMVSLVPVSAGRVSSVTHPDSLGAPLVFGLRQWPGGNIRLIVSVFDDDTGTPSLVDIIQMSFSREDFPSSGFLAKTASGIRRNHPTVLQLKLCYLPDALNNSSERCNPVTRQSPSQTITVSPTSDVSSKIEVLTVNADSDETISPPSITADTEGASPSTSTPSLSLSSTPITSARNSTLNVTPNITSSTPAKTDYWESSFISSLKASSLADRSESTHLSSSRETKVDASLSLPNVDVHSSYMHTQYVASSTGIPRDVPSYSSLLLPIDSYPEDSSLGISSIELSHISPPSSIHASSEITNTGKSDAVISLISVSPSMAFSDVVTSMTPDDGLSLMLTSASRATHVSVTPSEATSSGVPSLVLLSLSTSVYETPDQSELTSHSFLYASYETSIVSKTPEIPAISEPLETETVGTGLLVNSLTDYSTGFADSATIMNTDTTEPRTDNSMYASAVSNRTPRDISDAVIAPTISAVIENTGEITSIPAPTTTGDEHTGITPDELGYATRNILYESESTVSILFPVSSTPLGIRQTPTDAATTPWTAVLGGVLGAIALAIIVVALLLYYSDKRKHQVRHGIYNVNPKIMTYEPDENGTTGQTEVPLETEQL